MNAPGKAHRRTPRDFLLVLLERSADGSLLGLPWRSPVPRPSPAGGGIEGRVPRPSSDSLLLGVLLLQLHDLLLFLLRLFHDPLLCHVRSPRCGWMTSGSDQAPRPTVQGHAAVQRVGHGTAVGKTMASLYAPPKMARSGTASRTARSSTSRNWFGWRAGAPRQFRPCSTKGNHHDPSSTAIR